ncbi:hypothetical protein F5884DRAFT_760837 [Xylogone sp. PMI_703]|nr:hypothetical protein F5884DRAFT_760837 [Xylogone sp. PMI_703]
MVLIDTIPQLTTFHLFPTLPTELRLKIWEFTLPTSHRIVKIEHRVDLRRYISNTPPPGVLHANHEARTVALRKYTHLDLGTNTYIPIDFTTDILYIGNLAPILQNHMHDFLYNLSTTPARHRIRELAIDRRVWNELSDNGLMGVLCAMRSLNLLYMVIEFGRVFGGELGFLSIPEWRRDLKWLENRTKLEILRERQKKLGGPGRLHLAGGVEMEQWKLDVKCVILTRGGEHA